MKKIAILFLFGVLAIGLVSAVGPDFNLDGWVNGNDLGTLLGAWGNVTNQTAFADLNQDLIVNGTDINILLANWGPYPQQSDLVVSHLTYSTTDNTVSVTATVKNAGAVTVGENFLLIQVNDEQAGASISQLAPQQEFTFQWTFAQVPTRGMQISAYADALDQIAESNEKNNYVSTFIGK